MYVTPNFKTKKQLKEAVKAYNDYQEAKTKFKPLTVGAVWAHKLDAPEPVKVFSPDPFPPNMNGTEFIEGPHYPKPHTWYAQVEVKNGVVVKVK